MTRVPDLATIRAGVSAYEPDLRPARRGWQAATALILHDAGGLGPEVLFIERATRRDDRWSGQMALPGGRHELRDQDLAATAVREAREEVGVELAAPIGRLDDQSGRASGGRVATFVFELAGVPDLAPDPAEVQTAVWIPVAELVSPSAAIRHEYRALGRFPAIRYERFTIWGLTHRILTNFVEVVGARLADPA